MNVEVYTLNAFAEGERGGNPAGVVLEQALSLDAAQMQLIAKELGFSETAFMEKSLLADYKIRYFTPASEVDLCGHATIAAFGLMHSLGLSKEATSYSIETKAGILDVDISSEGLVYLSQVVPQFFERISCEEIAPSLRMDAEELQTELPIQIVSTGLRDIMIPIRSRKLLNEIQPNFDAIIAISEKYDVVGYHLFTMDTPDDSAAECRNFAPLYDIPEESATGTSNGALLSYLYQYGQRSLQEVENVMFRQGYSMDCPSEIKAGLRLSESGEINQVRVGGAVARIERRHIMI
ncbi:PhzF family phenazine biosynthesis protein [Paenibacillus sp. FSL P4-0338]|uniref:PhzF family phenazine biosynthesis protein n=1 Tax=unclassified Paenibacillus TaxID=185978 RepID=UPI0003E2225D|nr:PhzF family phenazine biosynthesis protein [Paenibacillus sp. FSL R7-269]ETT47957.1 phenazine biosynthesis protein PhzF family [Paenibacillus sp. FSL R7-269]